MRWLLEYEPFMEQSDVPNFFHPERSLDRSQRNLPHWDQEGVVTFVTFRLADSIPAPRMAEWEQQRRRWLAVNGQSGQGNLQDVLANLTPEKRTEYLREFGAQFHRLLDDSHGECLLRVPACSALVVSALLHFDARRYGLGEYVVMANHVHLMVTPMSGYPLTMILRSWKSYSARRINELLGREGQVWQKESFDHLVRDAPSLRRFERYIRENPTKARLSEGEYLAGRGSMPIVA
jgi:putative transposase